MVIVRNFIALQFAAAGLYLFLGTMVHFARLWRGVPLVQGVPFTVAQAIFIFTAETIIILYIFFMWYRETFRLQAGALLHSEGVLVRRHRTIALERIAAASYAQGPFAKLAGYGTVALADKGGARLARFSNMAEPAEFVAEISGRRGPDREAEPLRLVMESEHATLERKATLRCDLATGKPSRVIEKAAVKTVAAFMNTEGGTLLLGVGDDGRAVGLERDWATLARKDADGWENHFSNILSAMLGPSLRQYATVRHFVHEGRACAMVSVAAAPRPVYMADNGTDEFFVRTGNATTALRMSEAHEYIGRRWA
jgi:membrane protein YdbS with pleckstrin-like domain